MQLHEVQPKNKNKRSKRIGRGGKKGTYSGRGMKGQKSRSGRRFQPIIRELIKRYPKLRGYRFKAKIKNQKPKAIVLNLDKIGKNFKPGETVSPQILIEKHLIRKISKRTPEVKILGKGDAIRELKIESCDISKQAKEKIEKAGGMVEDKNQALKAKSKK